MADIEPRKRRGKYIYQGGGEDRIEGVRVIQAWGTLVLDRSVKSFRVEISDKDVPLASVWRVYVDDDDITLMIIPPSSRLEFPASKLVVVVPKGFDREHFVNGFGADL